MNETYSTIVRVCSRWWPARWQQRLPAHLPRLMYPDALVPGFVRDCAVTARLCTWLELLEWDRLPVLCARHWFGPDPVPLAAYLGAYLVKIDQGLPTMSSLRRFLGQHPALVWALGFPLLPDRDYRHGFDVARSLPSQRQFSRRLSQLPHSALHLLLDEQVAQLQRQLPVTFGQTVSLDTKHILAWVSAPCHGVMYFLIRGCGLFALPIRSPPLVAKETELRT